MNPLSALAGVVAPVASLLDSLHVSDEERGKVQAELTRLHNDLAGKLLDYQAQLVTAQAAIVAAEAQGGSWMQRNWRPITMLTFLVLVVGDALGLLPFRLAEQAWDLLQLGMGGYVIGRSVEKAAPALAGAVQGRKKGGNDE